MFLMLLSALIFHQLLLGSFSFSWDRVHCQFKCFQFQERGTRGCCVLHDVLLVCSTQSVSQSQIKLSVRVRVKHFASVYRGLMCDQQVENTTVIWPGKGLQWRWINAWNLGHLQKCGFLDPLDRVSTSFWSRESNWCFVFKKLTALPRHSIWLKRFWFLSRSAPFFFVFFCFEAERWIPVFDVEDSFVVAWEVVFKNEAFASRKLHMHKGRVCIRMKRHNGITLSSYVWGLTPVHKYTFCESWSCVKPILTLE